MVLANRITQDALSKAHPDATRYWRKRQLLKRTICEIYRQTHILFVLNARIANWRTEKSILDVRQCQRLCTTEKECLKLQFLIIQKQTCIGVTRVRIPAEQNIFLPKSEITRSKKSVPDVKYNFKSFFIVAPF